METTFYDNNGNTSAVFSFTFVCNVMFHLKILNCFTLFYTYFLKICFGNMFLTPPLKKQRNI